MAGLFFEEFGGQVFEHAHSAPSPKWTMLLSTLTMNPQPLHLDEEFAKRGVWPTPGQQHLRPGWSSV
jgi:acyl dehydratase